MLVNIEDSKINGAGAQVYVLSVVDACGDHMGSALWLADSEDHLHHQLYADYLQDEEDTQEAKSYYLVEVRPGYLIEVIGQAVPNGQ